MAASEGDFFAGEELDDLFLLLDGGFLDGDADLNMEVDAVVSEVAADSNHTLFKCNQCDKTCKSKRGLTRHTNTKHTVQPSIILEPTDPNFISEKDQLSLKKLPLSKLTSVLKNCAIIVAADLCLPEVTRKIFESFTFSLEETQILWEKLRPIIDEFNGNAEKFYSQFYGLLAENNLPSKFDITSSNILMSEVANHLIIYLSDKNTDTSDPQVAVTSITDKETKCLQYVSGFILHKLHNKFRFSKNCSNVYNRQCVAILQACKIDSDDTQTLVNARDRGGLWKVNKNMQVLFIKSECIFRSKTSQFAVKIVCADIVKNMLENCTITSKYKTVCSDIDPKVNSEISMNLLEQILTLFVRIRTFSFAKDFREKHKAAKKATRKRSLRTEIKQASSSTDGGH
jgi:hypothetical protein